MWGTFYSAPQGRTEGAKLKKPNTTPEGLRAKPEHKCNPLGINNQLVATCIEHWMQAPVLRK
jgi:hypothetical protein